MSEIPKELRKRRNAILLAASENGGEFASDEDMEAFQLIERIARAEAKVAALEASRNMHALNAVEMMGQRDALEAENGRLKAAVSDAEWDAANYRQAVETSLGESSTGGEMLVWHSYTSRDKFDALIAARAQQRSPAQDKEQG